MQGKLGYFAGNFYLNVNELRQVATAQSIVCRKYSNDKLKRLPLPQSCTIVLLLGLSAALFGARRHASIYT